MKQAPTETWTGRLKEGAPVHSCAQARVLPRNPPRVANQMTRDMVSRSGECKPGDQVAVACTPAATRSIASKLRSTSSSVVAQEETRSEERRVGKECRCRWAPDE